MLFLVHLHFTSRQVAGPRFGRLLASMLNPDPQRRTHVEFALKELKGAPSASGSSSAAVDVHAGPVDSTVGSPEDPSSGSGVGPGPGPGSKSSGTSAPTSPGATSQASTSSTMARMIMRDVIGSRLVDDEAFLSAQQAVVKVIRTGGVQGTGIFVHEPETATTGILTCHHVLPNEASCGVAEFAVVHGTSRQIFSVPLNRTRGL